MTTKSKAGATTRKRLFASKYKPPTAAARKNAAALAKIIGGTAEDVGRRCTVQIGLSQKLPNIDGSVECRDAVVSLILLDISPGEVGAMLMTLVYARGGWKNRRWTKALNKFFDETGEGKER